MKAYRFWQVREALCGRPDAIPYHLHAWGGSNRDGEDAGVAADMRLSWLKERVQFTNAPLKDAELYGYGTAVIREEWLELVAGSEDAPEAVVTRNRYGAPVLNARSLAMVDIDFPDAAVRGLAFWKKAVDPAAMALAKLQEWQQRNPRVSLRAYRTPKGLRVLRTDEAVAADSPDGERLLQELGNDPLYAALCKRQQCFRGRLGPKPWRVPLPLPPTRFPRQGEAQARFALWLAAYERDGGRFAACRFLQSIGEDYVAQPLAVIVDAHDRLSGALSGKPIA
jgi:hypothetical protein